MKIKLISILILFSFFMGKAQDTATDEAKVRDIIAFYQFMVNTVGADNTSARDKEVIIKESFKKVFLNEKVQIEDDLEENRSVTTYKNVRSYLQDVDFFYRNVAFEFEILGIEAAKDEKGDIFYKVEMNRKLTAINLDKVPVTNTRKRFIEINQNPTTGDLKIASIYTNRFNRDAQLQEWWLSLSLAWREVFFAKFGILGDSIPSKDLNRMAMLDSLDLNGNTYVATLDPTYVLTNLSYIDISNTHIESLQPLRSTSKLTGLVARNAPISDLQYLKFNEGLIELDLGESRVTDISQVSRFTHLKQLNLANLSISDYSLLGQLGELEGLSVAGSNLNGLGQLSGLSQLKKLDASNSAITSLAGVSGLSGLTELNISYTSVSDLAPLANASNMKTLFINQTQVIELRPVVALMKLTKIYAENTPITDSEIESFTAQRPKVLLVRNSKLVESWWGELSAEYKTAFSKQLDSTNPSTEALIRFLSNDTLNLSGTAIQSFKPLTAFKRLIYLKADNTNLKNVNGIQELTQLVYFSASLSKLTSLEENLPKKLKSLILSGTSLASLKPLQSLNHLTYLDIDNTKVPEGEVQEFIGQHQECMVIYRTDFLKNWWGQLTSDWQAAFRENMTLSKSLTKEELHGLTAMTKIKLKESGVTELAPLDPFTQLNALELSRLAIGNLSAIPRLSYLESLSISEMPVVDLGPLQMATNLKKLSLSGTGVSDLKPLSALITLEELDISATQVKRLNGIEDLTNLKKLNCSNTGVFTFGRVTALKNLRQVICFNTKLRENDLEVLRKAVPDCQITFY